MIITFFQGPKRHLQISSQLEPIVKKFKDSLFTVRSMNQHMFNNLAQTRLKWLLDYQNSSWLSNQLIIAALNKKSTFSWQIKIFCKLYKVFGRLFKQYSKFYIKFYVRLKKMCCALFNNTLVQHSPVFIPWRINVTDNENNWALLYEITFFQTFGENQIQMWFSYFCNPTIILSILNIAAPYLCPSLTLTFRGIHSCQGHSVPLLPSSWSINLPHVCIYKCVCLCVSIHMCQWY